MRELLAAQQEIDAAEALLKMGHSEVSHPLWSPLTSPAQMRDGDGSGEYPFLKTGGGGAE